VYSRHSEAARASRGAAGHEQAGRQIFGRVVSCVSRVNGFGGDAAG
jgi:hypothetical protein